MPSQWSLAQAYDAYPRVEEEFQAALDESLCPRGPEMLYDLVGDLRLPPEAVVVDAGCGEGRHAVWLAERFGFAVNGFDPVPRHIELAGEELAAAIARPDLRGRVCFEIGTAEHLPMPDGTADLVWCRDVLVHVAALDEAYAEFRRVLRAGGRVLVYQTFATDLLEPREADWLSATMGVVADGAVPGRTEAAIAAAGLRVERRIDLGTEWGEWAEETTGKGGRHMGTRRERATMAGASHPYR